MNLTTQQLGTLKAAIAADPVLAAKPMTSGGASEIADAFNLAASPAYTVWKSSVSEDEILTNGFDWTRLDNLSVGLARVWDKIFSGPGRTLNPGKANVRAGIEAVWVGSAADLAVRAAVYLHCKRDATRAEKLFATGTGSVAVPGVMAAEGLVTADNVQQARELP